MRIVGCILLLIASGCAGSVVQRPGGFILMSDHKGLKAWGEAQADLVNEAKASPDVKSSGYQLKELKSNNWLERMRIKIRETQEVESNG